MPALPASSLPERAPDELLVHFNAGAGAAGRAQALAAISGEPMEVLWSDGAGDAGEQLLRVKLTGRIGVDQAIEMLSQRPAVKFAEPDFVVSTQAVSNDLRYTDGTLWGMRGDSSGSFYGAAADEAWAAGYTGSASTVVGVVDSGIDYRHPDLYLNIWLNQHEIPAALRAQLTDINSDGLITFRDLNSVANASSVSDLNANGYIDAGDLLADIRWENGVDDDGNIYVDDLIGWDFVNNDNDPLDDQSHGTHVAGTIGGMGGNGIGVAGVNWSTQIAALKFISASGMGWISNAIKAINYFDQAAAVAPPSSDFVATNNSWGGGAFNQSLLDAIIRTGAAGHFFIAAAGNNAYDNDITSHYPSNYSTETALGWDAVVAVAATTSAGSRSAFSNFGNLTVDLAAPGSSILSTTPDGSYGFASGTSMAAPHVTGALALISAALPNASPQQLLEILRQCVTYDGLLAPQLAWDGRLDLGKLAALLPPGGNGPVLSSILISDKTMAAGETATVTIEFAEAVTGFISDDLIIPAGVVSVSDFGSTDGRIWTATLTPAADTDVQGLTLSVAAGSYASVDGDRLGSGFTSAAFAVDTKAPRVDIAVSDSQLVLSETARIAFRFSEAVTGFDMSDVTVPTGLLSDWTRIDAQHWTAVFTPSTGVQSALNSIVIDAGSYTDIAGNIGLAGSSVNFTIDTSGAFINGTDGSDALTGTDGADMLNGVPATSTRYGRGSVDVLIGNGGSDRFALGTAGQVFYDDGVARSAGRTDYALIADFTAGVDTLQLAGGRDYLTLALSIKDAPGLAIYWDSNANGTLDTKSDELIGLLAGVTSLSSSDILLV